MVEKVFFAKKLKKDVGDTMGIFDVNEEKLRALYHRAWVEAGRGFVDPRKYPYLDKALYLFARKNGCSYDEAVRIAKSL